MIGSSWGQAQRNTGRLVTPSRWGWHWRWGGVVLSVADQPAEVRTKRFRGTVIHQKLKQAIEIGGNCYAHK